MLAPYGAGPAPHHLALIPPVGARLPAVGCVVGAVASVVATVAVATTNRPIKLVTRHERLMTGRMSVGIFSAIFSYSARAAARAAATMLLYSTFNVEMAESYAARAATMASVLYLLPSAIRSAYAAAIGSAVSAGAVSAGVVSAGAVSAGVVSVVAVSAGVVSAGLSSAGLSSAGFALRLRRPFPVIAFLVTSTLQSSLVFVSRERSGRLPVRAWSRRARCGPGGSLLVPQARGKPRGNFCVSLVRETRHRVGSVTHSVALCVGAGGARRVQSPAFGPRARADAVRRVQHLAADVALDGRVERPRARHVHASATELEHRHHVVMHQDASGVRVGPARIVHRRRWGERKMSRARDEHLISHHLDGDVVPRICAGRRSAIGAPVGTPRAPESDDATVAKHLCGAGRRDGLGGRHAKPPTGETLARSVPRHISSLCAGTGAGVRSAGQDGCPACRTVYGRPDRMCAYGQPENCKHGPCHPKSRSSKHRSSMARVTLEHGRAGGRGCFSPRSDEGRLA